MDIVDRDLEDSTASPSRFSSSWRRLDRRGLRPL